LYSGYIIGVLRVVGTFRASCIDLVLFGLCSFQTIDIGCEFDDLLKQIGRFAFPVRHRFRSICVARRELYFSGQLQLRDG